MAKQRMPGQLVVHRLDWEVGTITKTNVLIFRNLSVTKLKSFAQETNNVILGLLANLFQEFTIIFVTFFITTLAATSLTLR